MILCCTASRSRPIGSSIVITRRRSFADYAEYWKDFVAHFNDVHACGYNSTGSVGLRIRMKFGAQRVYCPQLALTDFGCDPRRSESGTASRNFFCQVNNARLCRFPVSRITRNLRTKRGSERWWILSENIFENLPVRVFFPKGNFWATVFNDFGLLSGRDISEMITNLGKLWQVGQLGNVGFPSVPLESTQGHSPGLQPAYKKRHSWTSSALPSSAADVMSQNHSHGDANNLTLTLHYC